MSGSGRVSIYIYIYTRWPGRRVRRRERNEAVTRFTGGERGEGRRRGRRREREAARNGWSRDVGVIELVGRRGVLVGG